MKSEVNFLTFIKENPKGLYLVTGEIGTGKSVFSQKMLASAQKEGFGCEGILTPGVFEENVKTAILMQDIKSGEERLFAQKVALMKEPCDDLRMGQWCMDEATLEWGNQCLRQIQKTGVLFIDELGPLEFWRKKGLLAGLELMEKQAFEYAFVVIRPSLIDEVKSRFDVRGVIELDEYDLTRW